MTIQQFGLTAEQILKRRDGIGGSDANIIMGGDPAAILHLWEIKTGQAESENLSRVLPVQMGTWTEPLNRHWYTLMTGNEVTRAGETETDFDLPWMRCTLDGEVRAEAAIFEAKHVNAFAKIEEVAQKYMPQLHHNMRVCGLHKAVLSVFMGTLKYEHFLVEADPFYTATLIDAEMKFWDCVKTMTPPGEVVQAVSPTLPVQFRTVDMTGSNEWADAAFSWRENKLGASIFENATKALKGSIEFDVGEAFGHGVQIKRSKAGALTIREMKNA